MSSEVVTDYDRQQAERRAGIDQIVGKIDHLSLLLPPDPSAVEVDEVLDLGGIFRALAVLPAGDEAVLISRIREVFGPAAGSEFALYQRVKVERSRILCPGYMSTVKSHTLEELLALNIPERQMLLTPIITEKSLIMVYAKRGIGKSHFAQEAAFAVATGGTYLNFSAPNAAKCVIIDGEMATSDLQKRFAAIVASSPNELLPQNLTIIANDLQERTLPDLATEPGQRLLEEQIPDETQLIVIDNLSTLLRSGKENEGDSWLIFQAWILKLRRDGKAVVLIHHAGKNNDQRGTSRREDVLDVVIKLEHPGDYQPSAGARFVVKFEKARSLYGAQVEPIEATLITNDGGRRAWSWGPASANTGNGGTVQKIKALSQTGLTQAQIARELGVAPSTVSRALKG